MGHTCEVPAGGLRGCESMTDPLGECPVTLPSGRSLHEVVRHPSFEPSSILTGECVPRSALPLTEVHLPQIRIDVKRTVARRRDTGGKFPTATKIGCYDQSWPRAFPDDVVGHRLAGHVCLPVANAGLERTPVADQMKEHDSGVRRITKQSITASSHS